MRRVFIQDRDLSVMDIMDNWPETLPIFIKYKMLCVGCSIAPFHTVKEACVEHQLDETVIRDALDKVVADASTLGSA